MSNIMPNADFELVHAILVIENKQLRVRKMLVDNAQESVVGLFRARVARDLFNIRAQQLLRAPRMSRLIEAFDVEKPEDARLFLPSQYQSIQQQELRLQTLGHAEYILRAGYAKNQLQSLRVLIRVFKTQKASMHVNAVGGMQLWQFRVTMAKTAKLIRATAEVYERHRSALLTLGLPANNQALQPLRRAHLSGGLPIF
ncbi:hypothetical protein B0H17DRAFT_1148767 [Mycena rosella]|uniref:Uncharacterized protein n=1 Tax=Mycena rosella TaxID=1033263 RepID=A0AAD7FX58_MYCRO|nr:hypothetical protein B0H17DRAFT_1148767 [Mycena rosella]